MLHVHCTLKSLCYVTLLEIECLFAVAGIQASQYDEQFVVLFTTTLTQLKQVRLSVANAQHLYFFVLLVVSILTRMLLI